MSSSAGHIALFPSPGMGHVIPFVALAKLLLHRGHISGATLILPNATSATHHSLLQSLPENIRHHLLPPVDLNEDLDIEAQINHTVALCMPPASDALAALHPPPAALVVDCFGLELVPAAKELGVPAYMYFCSAAINLLFMFHLPRFNATLADDMEFADMADPFVMPGCVPIHGRDFGYPFRRRQSETYKRFLDHATQASRADGILVNSFKELEAGGVNALKEDPKIPPVYVIGPIIGSGQDSPTCPKVRPVVEWLDGQPDGSVLYISFGSGGTLSYEQTKELALGLEESGQRFLWVVRCPNNASSCPNYCSGGDSSSGEIDPLLFLPEGFIDRTQSKGLMVPNWAPQVNILSHKATGGFLTHCGWNSVLESVMHGVPMIAWPLYAEQPMNAVLLADGLQVALRPDNSQGGSVSRDEVASVVKRLMEGSDSARLHDRAKELQDTAKEALGEGGSSTLTLEQLALTFKCSMVQPIRFKEAFGSGQGI